MGIFEQLSHKDRGRAAYQGRTGSTKLGLNAGGQCGYRNLFGKYLELVFLAFTIHLIQPQVIQGQNIWFIHVCVGTHFPRIKLGSAGSAAEAPEVAQYLFETYQWKIHRALNSTNQQLHLLFLVSSPPGNNRVDWILVLMQEEKSNHSIFTFLAFRHQESRHQLVPSFDLDANRGLSKLSA